MSQIDLSMDEMAQVAHIGVFSFLNLVLILIFSHPILWFLASVIFAAVKEGWWDVKYETPETAGNGWEDFSTLCGGALIGMLTSLFLQYLYHHHWLKLLQ